MDIKEIVRDAMREAKFRMKYPLWPKDVPCLVRYSRLAVISLFGNICIACGEEDISKLEVNHVYGGGLKEYWAIGGSSTKVFQSILNGTRGLGDFDIRCMPCNIEYEPVIRPGT